MSSPIPFKSQMHLHHVPLGGRVDANQKKVILSDHCFLKHVNPLGVVSFRMTMPPSIGHEGSLNGLMSMKMM